MLVALCLQRSAREQLDGSEARRLCRIERASNFVSIIYYIYIICHMHGEIKIYLVNCMLSVVSIYSFCKSKRIL